MRIAIVGGGINGFCCAVKIQQQLREAQVTVISEEFTPNTTGDGSAGLWGPFLLAGTSQQKVHNWSKGMHKFLEQLWLSEDAGKAGVCLLPVVRLSSESAPMEDFWQDIVYGCFKLTPAQLQQYNQGKQRKFTTGMHFITFTSEPVKLLPYLMQRFQANGGKILQQKVHSLEHLMDNSPNYDVIINCTGLGAKQLLQDAQMFAVRGQVSRVKANWLYFALLDESDDGNYIIPNVDSVVLGGTHQKNDYSIEVSETDKNFIIQGCQRLLPALTHAQHLHDWVGLRPGREQLRLEKDENVTKKILIHNYGHGGSGVTLAWGCADDVLKLLQAEVQKRAALTSKL